MQVSDLPSLNATLNSMATILLVAGWLSIKAGKKGAHVGFMVSALLVSSAFLTSYLIYHYYVGSVAFQGKGSAIRITYFTILITHIFLAIVNLPMIILTVIPTFRRRYDKHRRIARWTLPIWLYVSVTGVIVYFMCYIWFA